MSTTLHSYSGYSWVHHPNGAQIIRVFDELRSAPRGKVWVLRHPSDRAELYVEFGAPVVHEKVFNLGFIPSWNEELSKQLAELILPLYNWYFVACELSLSRMSCARVPGDDHDGPLGYTKAMLVEMSRTEKEYYKQMALARKTK